MKKKIFFLIHSMNVGGVEKSLLGLLSILPYDKLEIHLGVLHKKGGFWEFLPKDIIVHEIDCYARYWRLINDPPLQILKQMLKHKQLMDFVVYTLLYSYSKITSNRYWFYKYILRKESSLSEEYDLAISFAGPSQMLDYYICKKVQAKVKCGWIHFDVSKFGIDKGMMNRLYRNYEKIFIVSDDGKKIFDKIFPSCKEKSEVFHNVVSYIQVQELAKIGETFVDSFIGKRILTVGRVSVEKGQREALYALKILINLGYNLKWYFVGDGNDMGYCSRLVDELNLTNYVEFYGTKTNPYGYMKDCDIYVQPSRHEGFCITLAEALCFANPIVATNFTGAIEQLKNRDNGVISKMSAEDIAKGIECALSLHKCSKVVTETKNDINKLLSLIE